MKNLAGFCHFYHMSPADYWSLTLPEYNALSRYAREYEREMKKANGR